MKISRLDKIIEDNVEFSMIANSNAQKIAILQDISETLAMIYDKLCDKEPVSMSNIPVSKMATFVLFSHLQDGEATYIEFTDYKEGYDIEFVRYEVQETIDTKNNEKREEMFAVMKAFGEEMRLSGKDYNKTWRCWTAKPNDTEKMTIKWIK